MPDSLESAMIIQLIGTINWSAALPPVNQFTGTLTSIDPGLPLDIADYARRDREFQHRDMINAAAVAKVSIHSRTVWNGTVVQPVLQGVTRVTDQSGTNVILPLDPSQVGTTLPNSSTAVQYVLNADVPYAAVTVTDVDLYNRDLLLYETLASAAALFPDSPPINQIDPTETYIGETSVWATAQGTNRPKVPNAAEPMSQATLKDPDLYLAERDNQVAAYVSRVVQALKNPFDFASRIYVQIDSTNGADARESETYVLTNNVFVPGNTYTAGEQVLYLGVWYQAINTTTDTPPSSAWDTLSGPTKLQFLAEPSLDSRNRIVYDIQGKTLQWFRETLDLIHVPQIAGFFIPGILPGQAIQTVPLIPEQKDAQFFRQKASHISYANGTFANEQVFSPTGNRDSTETYVTGAISTLFQSGKAVTLMMPDTFNVNFQDILCNSGTYALNCLVRPSPATEIAGGDNSQGSVDTANGGTDYSTIGDIRNWEVPLPAGGWQLFIEFANISATTTSAFGIKASQGAIAILANTLPLYYTDANGNPLPENTVISSPAIDIQSTGQVYNFSIQWTAGAGQLHIRKLRFVQTNGPSTSHYIMQASWIAAQGTNSVSNLDVIGQANMADVMPFSFYLLHQDTAPQIQITWLPKSASTWQSKSYNPGDQVLYNLVYWQANAITSATDIPGQSSVWSQLGVEPQIPLVFEQIQLLKFVQTGVTPEVVGFQGFRQDMLERALRADQDAYTLALFKAGTNFPEFRQNNTWTLQSTGSWMNFMEVYQPRLRQVRNIQSGGIVQGRQYEVITQTGENIIYNSVRYANGQRFYGVSGISTFSKTGSPIVNQVGAYLLSRPGDIGKTGLIPAGVEFVISAGTGTVAGWYPSYASYPTHQAIQPWMIDQGFYVAHDDLQSPDGNPLPTPALENPPAPHPPPVAAFLIEPTDDTSAVLPSIFGEQLEDGVSVADTIYILGFGGSAFSSADGHTWVNLASNAGAFGNYYGVAYGAGLFVAVGPGGLVATSIDMVTWTQQTSNDVNDISDVVYANGKFVAVDRNGGSIVSTDGVTWTFHDTGAGNSLLVVTHGNGVFVAAGANGSIVRSADGISWSTETSGTVQDLRGIAFGNSLFTAIGNSATVLTSPNGVTWTSQSTILSGDQFGLTFGNSLFVVTAGAKYAYSENGVNWTVVTLDTPYVVTPFYFKDLTFVLLETSPPV